MKKALYLILGLVIISCGKEGSNNHEITPLLVDNDLMTEGNDLDPGSRLMWELERRANPATGKIPAFIRQRELHFAKQIPTNNSRDLGWTHIGPSNVGGRTRALGIDVLNENIWIAGGVTGGIWRSTDAGQNWVKVTNPLDLHSITCVVQDTRPGKENVWYAGTGENYGIVSHTTFEAQFSGNGALKSIDNGLTWQPLTSTQSNTPETYLENGDMDFIWRMVTDPSDLTNDVVLAAVYNGVKYSNDGGTTWQDVLGFATGGWSSPGCNFVELVVTPSGVFYATLSSDGPSGGIYRSDDGLTWTDITPSFIPTSWGRLAMAINPQDENELWFFGNTNNTFGNGHSVMNYKYVSGDGTGAGGVWDDRSQFLPDVSCLIDGITTDLGKLSTQSSYDVHIAVHPTDPNVIYIAGTSIWRNTDGFTHDSTNKWIGGYQCTSDPYDSLSFNYTYPNHHPDQHFMTFLPSNPNILINSNDGGIFKTVDNLVDSVSWIPLNNGYVTSQFYAVAIEPGEATSDIVIGGLQDNGTWFTNTTEIDSSWKYIGLGDGMFCAISENQEFYIVSSQRGKLRIKEITPDGTVLNHERIDPDGGPSTYNWCNPLKLDANDPHRLYWNGRTRIWMMPDISAVNITNNRTDKEDDSLWVKIDETAVSGGAGYITDIEVAKGAPNRFWYGSSNGKLYRCDNANSPTPSKVDITGADFPFGSYIASISVNPFLIDEIVVAFANYEVPSVFYTQDGGITWTDISGNLEENPDGSGSGPACSWVELYPDGTILLGTTVGLVTTTLPDGQNTIWTLEPGIGNVVINHMDYRTYDGKIVVGTHGQGVYATNMPPAYVGMERYASKDALAVYPTLADDQIQVSIEKGEQLRIFDLNGKLIYQENLNADQTQINVSEYKSGMYLVVVTKGDQRLTKKFVKK